MRTEELKHFWPDFIATFMSFANKEDIVIREKSTDEDQITFYWHDDDRSVHMKCKISYVGEAFGYDLVRVFLDEDYTPIVSSPHAAFAVCYCWWLNE